MNRLKLAVIASGALFATPVLAQDADPSMGGDTASGDMSAGGEAGMEGAPMEGTPTEATPTDTGMAAPAMTGWPKEAIDRPYYRDKGKSSAGADMSLLKIADPTGMGDGITVDFITVHGSYGITPQISAGLDYAFSLGLGDGDFQAAGPLTLWGGYQIKNEAKMSMAASAAFSVDLDDTDNMGIGLGLGFRYKVAPKIAVFTGSPYGPGAVGGTGFAGGPFANIFGGGGHLSISLADGGPILLDLPVGGMFQATPELNIYAMTSLASIGLSNSPYVDDMGEQKSAVIFGADLIPLTLGGLYAINEKMDVTASFALVDLKEVGFDLFTFTAGIRAYL